METAWIEIDQKKERLAELEEVVDVQRETLEIAHKDPTTEKKKTKIITRECKEKDEEFYKLFCKFSKKKLERLLVAREEISYLRALSNLDTSFDEQVNLLNTVTIYIWSH